MNEDVELCRVLHTETHSGLYNYLIVPKGTTHGEHDEVIMKGRNVKEEKITVFRNLMQRDYFRRRDRIAVKMHIEKLGRTCMNLTGPGSCHVEFSY
jgi:hypothetical protein